MAFCQNCGAQLHGVSKFCPNCGTPVPVLEKPAAAPVQPEMPPIPSEVPAAEPAYTASVSTAVLENEPAPTIPPQEPVVQQPVSQQAAYQPPAPQQPVYQQPAYQQSVPPQAAYQQPVPQQTMYQPSAPQQPAYQQPMPQQAAYQQPAPQQSAYQQPGSQSQVPPVHPGYQQPVQAAAPNQAQMKKGMAILAYFGILVLIPLLTAKQDPFARYHTNQGLVLFLVSVICSVLSNVLSSVLLEISSTAVLILSGVFGVLTLVFFIFSIIGIVHAAKGQTKPLPLIGGIKLLK